MTNLLTETKKKMDVYGLVPEDIIYIGTNPNAEKPYYSCSWEKFTEIADFEYDSGFGGQEIAADLVIIFKNGTFMTRGEYDGSEWWNVHLLFTIPEETLPLEKLTGDSGWSTLGEIHAEHN